MYQPRRIFNKVDFIDPDGIKVYGISFSNEAIEIKKYADQLETMKRIYTKDWSQSAAFCIFHEGEEREYLVLCWWDNGNELFQCVAVKDADKWIIDNDRYSFCLYDMEIMWAERQFFIDTLDGSKPSLECYKKRKYTP